MQDCDRLKGQPQWEIHPLQDVYSTHLYNASSQTYSTHPTVPTDDCAPQRLPKKVCVGIIMVMVTEIRGRRNLPTTLLGFLKHSQATRNDPDMHSYPEAPYALQQLCQRTDETKSREGASRLLTS